MNATKRASKLVNYHQTNTDFVEKIHTFHQTGGTNASYKAVINSYTDVICSWDELWRFVCSLTENYQWTCGCSDNCKNWVVFSLAAQNLR
jgi:hypothetical protein